MSFRLRFDALEKQWGQTDWHNLSSDIMGSRRETPLSGNPRTQENIEVDYTIMTLKTAVGQFMIGYQGADQWGLDWRQQRRVP